MSDRIYEPSDPNAQQCVKNVLKYLSDITFEKMIPGQHTQTMAMEELFHIRKVTGREPALLGFELLSYSPNINYSATDEECMTEIAENYGTLRRAWEWAEKKVLLSDVDVMAELLRPFCDKGEICTMPDTEEVHCEKIGWAGYMTWSKVFCLKEEFNSFDYLKKLYSSPYAVTKVELPELY